MRERHPLVERWWVKELENDRPDIARLSREASAPDDTWLPARMPAQVHDVLLAHGKIADPRIGKNAAECAWVGEKDWAYACHFVSPPRHRRAPRLRFEGLDTLAAAYLNGEPLGRFDNMFREHTVDVSDLLAGNGKQNILLIVFLSPLRFVREFPQPAEHVGKISRWKYFRKATNDFHAYLGARPHCAKVGIYRDVVLELLEESWIEDICVRTELSPDHARATLRVQAEIGGRAGGEIECTLLDPDGREVAAALGGIEILAPKLWWPRTHGTPHLYRLQARLMRDGQMFDRLEVAFGIRDVRLILEDERTGEKRFQFEINHKRMFLQGACWAPVEGMTHCWSSTRAKRLLDLAEHARMNVLRVWAGGHVPPREFYDECDRRGILVWQDFMFEYGMYPDGDDAFDRNCRTEVEETIRALRNHPCILLWCGGNENYMGWHFQFRTEPTIGRELFEKIIPDVCAKLDPTRPYHRSSPYGGREPNWPLEGDWHDYSTLNFSHQASVPTFISELGRSSAPSLQSMKRFLSDEELWPAGHDPAIRRPGQRAWPPMWQYRSVDDSWAKIGPIEQFCEPSNAEDLIGVLGTAHGEYLQRTVERLRRGRPDGAPAGDRRCGGNMVWRLNDSWPIVYWAVIDYYLEPKIAYYFLRRAYAPVQISFERTPDRLAAWVVNDSPEVSVGKLSVKRMKFDGTVLGELTADVTLSPGASRCCLDTVDLGLINLRDQFLHARFAEIETTYLLTGERYLHLPPARLSVRRAAEGIDIATDVYARQVSMEMDGASACMFDDNFFDLGPGQARHVRILDAAASRNVTVRSVNAEPVHLTL